MPLTLTSDPSRPGGGYAILQVDTGAAPASLAFEDRSTGLFLAPGGKWTKQPHHFDVERIDAMRVRLGPDIVDHVDADAILALHRQDAGVLGVQVWPAIRPSAGAASGDVMPDRVEMAIVSAIGDSPAPSSPSEPPAAPASTALAPLPPPPPPPVRVEFAPKPAEPARRGGLLKPILIANGLLLLILGLFAFRGTDAAKALVCEPTGALYGIGFVKSLVACAEKAAVDPEETAYNDFLQCVPGQPACAQKRCGDAYLSAFVYGAHAAKVRAASAASQQACEAEAEKNNAAKIFSEFNDCMRITINVCNRSQCVDRYRYKLTTEPYASSLRQSAETAANDCRRSQEDAAYAQFNSCVAAAAACDTARCASAFTSTFPNSAYVPRVLQTAENAARTCAAERPIVQQPAPTPEPTPQPDVNSVEQAARNFVVRYYYTSSSQGEADGASLAALFAPQVNFYGTQKSSADILREKFAYNTRWDQRRFSVRDDSMRVNCNSSGQICRAIGYVEWDFSSSSLRKVSRGLSSFDFLIANPQNHPKVVGETSKVEQHY